MHSRPQRAGVAEHDVAGLGNVLVDLEAGRGPAQQHRQAGLAMLDRLAPPIDAIKLQEVEGRKKDPGIVSPAAQPFRQRGRGPFAAHPGPGACRVFGTPKEDVR
jgi:hypothetical protein